MDFVNRLVERTRSDRSVLRPVVGPLSSVGPSERLIDELREVAAVNGEPATAPAPAPAPVVGPAPGMLRAANEPTFEAVRPAPSTPIASPPHTPAIEMRRAPVLVADTTPSESVALATTAGGPVIRAQSTIAGKFVPPPERPSQAPVAERALTRNASTPTASSDASGDQVIRIHIGRVDVRAPAPIAGPAPAARRAAEPLPSVALGRYLDERGRRR